MIQETVKVILTEANKKKIREDKFKFKNRGITFKHPFVYY